MNIEGNQLLTNVIDIVLLIFVLTVLSISITAFLFYSVVMEFKSSTFVRKFG